MSRHIIAALLAFRNWQLCLPRELQQPRSIVMAFQECTPAVPTVQMDNAEIRITRWDFAPGAATGWHTHNWPYVVVMLTNSTMKLHDGVNISGGNFKAG